MEQSRLREFLFLALNILNILRYYILSEIIFVENSGRALGVKLIYFLNLFKKKKIILYPHTGAQVNPNSQYKIFEKPKVFQDKPNLFINKSNIKYYKKKYFFFKKFILIKQPINQEWINFIKSISKKKKDNYIVIYLNNFIDKKTYIYMLLITLKKLIKKNCRIKVYLKRHPRHYNYSLENKILNKILKKFKDKLKIKVISQSSFLLPIFSTLNISLISNAISMIKLLNKNSVYFFLNSFEIKSRFETLPGPMYDRGIIKIVGTDKISKYIQYLKF
jgi:hypothetical protein